MYSSLTARRVHGLKKSSINKNLAYLWCRKEVSYFNLQTRRLCLWNMSFGGKKHILHLYVHSKYTTAWDVPVSFLEGIMINDDVSMLIAEEKRQILICKMFCACTAYGTILYIKCIGPSWIKYDLQLAFIVSDSLVDLYFGPIRNPTAVLLFTRIWRKTVIH